MYSVGQNRDWRILFNKNSNIGENIDMIHYVYTIKIEMNQSQCVCHELCAENKLAKGYMKN